MAPESLKPILEAALLAAPQPLTPGQLAELFDPAERPAADLIAQALHGLAEDCGGRGIELVEVGSGFRYQVRPAIFPHISALWAERQSRYSRALLETMALIAYRQPITRGEIEQIRGVAVATSILRTIEERDWVRVVGHRDVPGKPALYGTTRAFLDYFKLRSLDELPPLSALRDLEALEPELSFDGSASPDGSAADPGTSEAVAGQDDRDAGEDRADAHAGVDADVDADTHADADVNADVEVDTEPDAHARSDDGPDAAGEPLPLATDADDDVRSNRATDPGPP